MSQRAASLADQFERINGALITAVESCSDADWRSGCQGEGWSVGVTAHHIALSYPAFQHFIEGIATGADLPPITMEMLHASNAQHAEEHANCTRDETLDLVRRNGRAVAETVRGLSDEQLDRAAPMALAGGSMISTQQMAEFLIGHPTEHLASIQSAVGSRAG
jgi:uncharacterized damage-inducible protein DinB